MTENDLIASPIQSKFGPLTFPGCCIIITTDGKEVSAMGRFGDFFKEARIRQRITLREFCLKYGLDAGNVSKLERGVLTPPQDVQKLKEYARHLGIKEGTTEWHTFVDLASAETGRVPADILTDKESIARLPILFRTLRNKKLTKKVLKELIEKLKTV